MKDANEKKEEFKLPDNMKIWCATEKYTTNVQEKLFSLGCKWGDNSTKVWHPMDESEYAIYCRNGKLTYAATREYFEDQEIDEYILDETLTNCFVKVPKENEDVVGADSCGIAENKVNESVDIKPDDNSLDSLFNQIVLLQKETDALSEQKEQIASKISAKTVAINILKEKMQELVSQAGLVFVGMDNAGVVKDDEPLNITDWWDLKVDDIIYVFREDCVVCEVEPEDYAYDYAFAVMTEEGMLWVDVSCDDWKFVSRPN